MSLREQRTLTTKAMELFEEKCDKHNEKLSKISKDIEAKFVKYGHDEKIDKLTYKIEKDYIIKKFEEFDYEATNYMRFVQDSRVVDWEQRKKTISDKLSAKRQTCNDFIDKLKSLRTEGTTVSSNLSSRSSVKRKVAQTKMRYAEEKAKLEKEAIELKTKEAIIAAQNIQKLAHIDIEKDLLESRLQAEVAAVEDNSVEDEFTEAGSLQDLPIQSSEERTANFVQSNQHVDHSCEETATNISKFLLKKELITNRIPNFNDKPEAYFAWKKSFKKVVIDIGASSDEEIDLLIKHLGPESRKSVSSLKIAYISNLDIGLVNIWDRLDERYGSVENIYSSVSQKLDRFPRLSPKEYAKLYDLYDILLEIGALKEDPKLATSFAYFDSSIGILPIVAKLPPSMQEKWASYASHYKKSHDVSFPPLSVFSGFIKEQAKIKNDTSLNVTRPSNLSGNDNRRNVLNVNKTTIEKEVTGSPGQTESLSVKGKFCPIHNSPTHSLVNCREFKSLSFDGRRKVLRDCKLCFRCFSGDHQIARCTSSAKCEHCHSVTHHSLLHFGKQFRAGTSETQTSKGDSSDAGSTSHGGEVVSPICTEICGDSRFEGKSCSKIVLVNVHSLRNPDSQFKVYAILDEQSNRSLVTPRLLSLLGINGHSFEYTLKSCSGSFTLSGQRVDDLVVESLDGKVYYKLPTVIECNDIPNNRHEIPTPTVAAHFSHLQNIAHNIPELDPDADISLLIGRDLLDVHHVLDQKLGPCNSPYAQQLSLGWVIIGETCLGKVHLVDTVNVNKTVVLPSGRPSVTYQPCSSCLYCAENIAVDIGAKVFEKTTDDEVVSLSIEDKEFLSLMDREMHKLASGNWSAPLPFQESRPRLPDNRQQVLDRARRLDRSLKKDPVKLDHFVTFMTGVIDSGHAEPAPPLKSSEHWYLPIFGIYHPQKPDQIRGVFDSSAKTHGLSLNNVLMSGPDLTNSLLGILLRFRKEAIAITGDIERMFYCFMVDEKHRDYLRFFWYKDNNPVNDMIEYRMCVHVFGNKPSPAVATYGLRKSVESSSPDVKSFVSDNFYVDDGLISLPTPVEAVDLMNRTRDALMQNGNLHLHKIASNSAEVMSCFPVEDLDKNLRQVDLLSDDLPLQRSLGMQWSLEFDCFVFSVSTDDKPFTRRGVLSTINSIYDPLGFIAPVVLSGKLILKELMQETSDWDKPLSDAKRMQWENWKISLKCLERLEVPRVYLPISFGATSRKEFHVYCDASERAIAAAVYLYARSNEGTWYHSFVIGKAKVAPKSGHTIPRLELCAAVLAVELFDVVSTNLSTKIDRTAFFSDSRVVLGYINNRTRRFYTYVSNRVDRILRSSKADQWYFVNTGSNPVDCATRPFETSGIVDSAWLCGPEKQVVEQENVLESFPLITPDTDREVRAEVKVLTTSTVDTPAFSSWTERFERFSCLSRLVNAISLLRNVVRSRTSSMSFSNQTCDTNVVSKTFVTRLVQNEVFTDEINCLRNNKTLCKDSAIINLDPFLDSDGVLRVGGRLRKSNLTNVEKHPVILPKSHHVSKLVVRHFHDNVKHQGRHFTEGAIRAAGYWIVGCKKLVSSIIASCVVCKRLRGQFSQQKMSDLPSDRLSPSPPFSYVGVDAFGPWEVVARRTRGGHARNKRWGIMFTCLVTRAVHIELVESMSASSFINAMRRLIAIRGPVLQFRSDRGTNFVGAVNELSSEIDRVCVEDLNFKKFLSEKGCVWLFNPPHSSHMGGVWERMIGITRNILNSMLLNVSVKNLTNEVLSTLMAEVAAIINARPLVSVSADPNCPEVLTPAMLVTQKSTPISKDNFDHVDYRVQWKHVQSLADCFWKRWRGEYLHTLQGRRKWKFEQPNFKVGDVVLSKDKEVHRNHWPLCVVSRVFPSSDGKVRKVEVRCSKEGGSQTYIRPISDLVLLLSE